MGLLITPPVIIVLNARHLAQVAMKGDLFVLALVVLLANVITAFALFQLICIVTTSQVFLQIKY